MPNARPIGAIAVSLLAVCCLSTQAQTTTRSRSRSLEEVGRDKAMVVLGPWEGKSSEAATARAAFASTLPSCEQAASQLSTVRGQTWCHVIAAGFEPILLEGDAKGVTARLKEGTLEFGDLTDPERGIFTGVVFTVTRHEQKFIDQPKPISWLSIEVVGPDGERHGCKPDRKGVFRMSLSPGTYKIIKPDQTSLRLAVAGQLRAKGVQKAPGNRIDVFETDPFADVTIRKGETTILDLPVFMTRQ